MFRSVLVANRGEIATRITRTLHRLGIEAVAVYSDADRHARHVRQADRALRLGPAPAVSSYLSIPRVIEALTHSGAEAVHPGYGFLSENAAFARAVHEAGAVWIGPPADAIEVMGDKIRAKRTMAAAGVTVVPGSDGGLGGGGSGGGGSGGGGSGGAGSGSGGSGGAGSGSGGSGAGGLDDEALVAAALAVGLPVLIKPSAGGGGKGMHRVDDAESLPAAIASARREALASFGDATLLVERWISPSRHIEVQVIADGYGTVVHLGERECSLQRRHQKIIEEAPSSLLGPDDRARFGASAVAATRACGYVGAGTVEFIVAADRPGEPFFLEMNTRLQVEHPVTEAVTGLDLVELQLQVAAGERLAFTQADVALRGHAMEARIYAEDPGRAFLPATGNVLAYREPSGPGLRIDSALDVGTVIGTDYDPLLAKVVAWAPDREEARRRLARALASTTVLGLTTNLGFLQDLLAVPEVVAGDLDTDLVERVLPDLSGERAVRENERVAAAAGLLLVLQAEPSGEIVDPWDLPGGWRVGGAAETVLHLVVAGRPVRIGVTGRAGDARVRVEDGAPQRGSARWGGAGETRTGQGGAAAEPGSARAGGAGELDVELEGVTDTWLWAAQGDDTWLGQGGRSWLVGPARPDAGRGVAGLPTGGLVTSPMPGTVLSVLVASGETVTLGQPLFVVEAMKMEHTVTAAVDGKLSAVLVRSGQAVALDEMLAEILPAGTEPGGTP